MLSVRRAITSVTVLAVLFTPFTTAHADDTNPTLGGTMPTTVSITTVPNVVEVGDNVVVTGAVTGGQRPLVMRFQTATGWSDVKTGTSTTTGNYTMQVPTDWYGKHVLVVTAPATDTYLSAESTPQRVRVKPDYKPGGSKTAWKPFTGARWNPCQIINFKTNLAGAPAGSLRTVKKVFRKMHAATGFDFNYAGSTTKVPFSGGPDQFDDRTLIIAYTTPAKVPRLKGNTVGLGGSSWMTRNDETAKEYIYGGVVLDSTDRRIVRPGFGHGSTQGALLMHEIGHALGLNHINSRSQIMYPMLLPSTDSEFGAGDLQGLQAIGASQGCM